MGPRDIFGPCSFEVCTISGNFGPGYLWQTWELVDLCWVGARARPGDCSDLEGLIQNSAAGQAQYG